MKTWPDQKPIIPANQYLSEDLRQKAYKISLDIGCTRPTRDGTRA